MENNGDMENGDMVMKDGGVLMENFNLEKRNKVRDRNTNEEVLKTQPVLKKNLPLTLKKIS